METEKEVLKKIAFLLLGVVILSASSIALYQQSHRHIFKYDATSPQFNITIGHFHPENQNPKLLIGKTIGIGVFIEEFEGNAKCFTEKTSDDSVIVYCEKIE